ncbi:MAG: hemN, partial [Hyphomicrobiales bacterium]|nr:hemN [Hyphomicrobiales bacterium]
EERLPRYTSYPTAPQFSRDVDRGDYARWLASLTPDVAGSLYLHVPFCRSMCWYCGCHTTITRHDDPIGEYIGVLRREIELVAEQIGQRLRVDHVHFGGGTPTIMSPDNFLQLMGALRERFNLPSTCEIAIEIDPTTLTADMARALGKGGVTRASLGVQTCDPVVQKAIHRIQSVAQTRAASEGLREVGVTSINFDLIYGLPHQTIASCLDTVARCVEMRPDRFAVFGYAHIPSFKKHQRVIDEAILPDGAQRFEQAETIAQALQQAGYRRIGLDHYALPGDSMVQAQESGALRRNFQGYTTDVGEALIGLGASAIGHLPQGYVQNEVSLPAYAKCIERGELATAKGYALSNDDRLRAEIIERIMCDFAVDLDAVCTRHGAASADLRQSAPRLAEFEADRLVSRKGAGFEIEPHARHLVRTVASAFDAYLGTAGSVHSKAV